MKSSSFAKANLDEVTGGQHKEGPIAKTIEHQTAKVPSDVFLWTAGGVVLASLALQIIGKKEVSNFVGQWVAPVLLLGVYNKIVKVAGSDQTESAGVSSAML